MISRREIITRGESLGPKGSSGKSLAGQSNVKGPSGGPLVRGRVPRASRPRRAEGPVNGERPLTANRFGGFGERDSEEEEEAAEEYLARAMSRFEREEEDELDDVEDVDDDDGRDYDYELGRRDEMFPVRRPLGSVAQLGCPRRKLERERVACWPEMRRSNRYEEADHEYDDDDDVDDDEYDVDVDDELVDGERQLEDDNEDVYDPDYEGPYECKMLESSTTSGQSSSSQGSSGAASKEREEEQQEYTRPFDPYAIYGDEELWYSDARLFKVSFYFTCSLNLFYEFLFIYLYSQLFSFIYS